MPLNFFRYRELERNSNTLLATYFPSSLDCIFLLDDACSQGFLGIKMFIQPNYVLNTFIIIVRYGINQSRLLKLGAPNAKRTTIKSSSARIRGEKLSSSKAPKNLISFLQSVAAWRRRC